MIRNIIFDMGNVLLNYDPRLPLEKYVQTETDRAVILKELFQGPEWIEGDLGYITVEEKYQRIKARVPERLHGELKDCVCRWHETMEPAAGAQEFVKHVQEKGYQTYILSNASTEFHLYFPRCYDVASFRGVVVSADIHMIKPDAGIYRYLLETYGLIPEESLFIDDRPENIEAARELGIKGVVFDGDFDGIEKEFHL